MSGFAGLRVHARAPFSLLFFCLGVGGPSRAPRPLSFERGVGLQMRQDAFLWPFQAEGWWGKEEIRPGWGLFGFRTFRCPGRSLLRFEPRVDIGLSKAELTPEPKMRQTLVPHHQPQRRPAQAQVLQDLFLSHQGFPVHLVRMISKAPLAEKKILDILTLTDIY